jgi:Acetyltransferases, including N-acetylases of ribosomal proteins
MKITIRRALPEDAFEYAACHIASWRSAYNGIVPDEFLDSLSANDRAERMKKNMSERKAYAYYCAICEKEIVGVLIIGKSSDESKAGAGEISAIYLVQAFWGKGFGKEMMDYALDTLKRDGYDEAILWVLEENKRARRFYEKCGFAFDGAKKAIEIGKVLTEMRYVRCL